VRARAWRSDAFIVGASADLDLTVPMAVTARVQNNGQACIAAKRYIVVGARADEFIERFTRAMPKSQWAIPWTPIRCWVHSPPKPTAITQ